MKTERSVSSPTITPLARWPLARNANGAEPGMAPGTNHGVEFASGDQRKPEGYAVFGGRGQHVSVPPHSSLRLGRGDFTITARVRVDAESDEMGDILSCFDPHTRTGFQLGLRTNAGVAHSQSNRRQLHFGIDAGSEPEFFDEGRPGDAVFTQSIAVHDGQLYVGSCVPGRGLGRVHGYAGPGRWIDLGSPDLSNSVTAMAAYDGALHVGTGRYRLCGSHLAESENPNHGGRVFRLTKEGDWQQIGVFEGMESVGSMVVFEGRLYVSSLYAPACWYRHEGGTRWTSLPVPGGERLETLTVFEGSLWAGSYDSAHVYRLDGSSWVDTGRVGSPENSQCYAFANHHGRLQVATWRSGKVFEWDGRSWQDRGRLGEELEAMGMLVYNGSLYAGSLPLAWLCRYDAVNGGRGSWSLLKRLDTTPDVEYRRVWTMAQHAGRLFATTIPSAHVWSMRAGACVTWDVEFPPGWRHVAAQREGDVLRLFVDGRVVAERAEGMASALDLVMERSWMIGGGSGGYFNGAIADVAVYRGALGREEICRLAARVLPE